MSDTDLASEAKAGAVIDVSDKDVTARGRPAGELSDDEVEAEYVGRFPDKAAPDPLRLRDTSRESDGRDA